MDQQSTLLAVQVVGLFALVAGLVVGTRRVTVATHLTLAGLVANAAASLGRGLLDDDVTQLVLSSVFVLLMLLRLAQHTAFVRVAMQRSADPDEDVSE